MERCKFWVASWVCDALSHIKKWRQVCLDVASGIQEGYFETFNSSTD